MSASDGFAADGINYPAVYQNNEIKRKIRFVPENEVLKFG